MSTEKLDALHNKLIIPLLQSGYRKQAEQLFDVAIDVGVAVKQEAPTSSIIVKLTDMRVEFNKMFAANSEVQSKLDKGAIDTAFREAISSIRISSEPPKKRVVRKALNKNGKRR